MRKTTKTIVSAISAIAMISAMTSSMMISANAAAKPADTMTTSFIKTTKVQVGVIDYVKNQTNEKDYQVRVWNDAGYTSDVQLRNTGKTEKHSLGDKYWEGAEQTFYLYEAEVPVEADSYKFHIGDRYFGGDGYLKASTNVYVFNFDGDKAQYVDNVNVKVVRVGVINFIDKENDSKNYKLHCWNNEGLATDVKLVGDGTTEQRSLGKEFWGGEKQTFNMYTAVLPDDATDYRFHIGDRYFGEGAHYGDRPAYSTARVAMIFNFNGDRAQYSVD